MGAQMLSTDQVLALRGLRLPSVALKGMQRVGIYCQPAVSIEFQQETQSYTIQGFESGGAIAQIGAYCGFVDSAGLPLPELRPVNSIAANGLHRAVLSTRTLVRVQMFRVATIYELLLTSHSLVQLEANARPRLENSLLFHGRHGILEMELWGNEHRLRDTVVRVFTTGEENGSRFQTTFMKPCFASPLPPVASDAATVI